jgi:hypothetical protein
MASGLRSKRRPNRPGTANGTAAAPSGRSDAGAGVELAADFWSFGSAEETEETQSMPS